MSLGKNSRIISLSPSCNATREGSIAMTLAAPIFCPTPTVFPLIVANLRAGAIKVDDNVQRGASFMPVAPFALYRWFAGRVGSINTSATSEKCQNNVTNKINSRNILVIFICYTPFPIHQSRNHADLMYAQ